MDTLHHTQALAWAALFVVAAALGACILQGGTAPLCHTLLSAAGSLMGG